MEVGLLLGHGHFSRVLASRWMGLTSEDGTHQGQTVFETAPDSTASKELNKLVSEILEIVA